MEIITATSATTVTLNSLDRIVDYVLLIAMKRKIPEPGQIDFAHALIDCEDMKKGEIRAAGYQGPVPGEKFFMPLDPKDRIRLKVMLKDAQRNQLRDAQGNPSNSFVTTSRTRGKLIWSVS